MQGIRCVRHYHVVLPPFTCFLLVPLPVPFIYLYGLLAVGRPSLAATSQWLHRPRVWHAQEDDLAVHFLLPPTPSLPCSSTSTDGSNANADIQPLPPFPDAFCRMYQQRVATTAIIVALVLLMLTILYFKLVR